MSQGKKLLDELQQLARPAVSHALLVQLARDEDKSPNQVIQIAESRGVPRRQAKAARFLAMLRRDYGRGALESFLSDMEHVRAVATATEHAHSEDKTMEKLKARLNLVTDPSHKLQLLVDNRLIEDAKALVMELIATLLPYFWWHGRDVEPRELFTPEDAQESPIAGVKIAFHAADTDLNRNRLNAHQDSVAVVNLQGMIAKLEMTDDETREVVRAIFERMMTYPINAGFFVWVIKGMQQACRHFLGEDKELAQQVERWTLLYHFRHGRLFELRQAALPTPIEDHPENECRELDPIVDRFAELGLSEDEIRSEFINWIKEHVENCRPQFMLAVAGAKCFARNDEERDTLIREGYLPKVWENVTSTRGGRFEVAMLGRFCGFLGEHREWKKEFFTDKLTDLVSKGKVARAYQLLVILGHIHFGFFWAESEDAKFSDSQKFLQKILPDAFKRAFGASRYGVAAALVQQFGVDAFVDEQAIRTEVEERFDEKLQEVDEQFPTEAEAWHCGEEGDAYFESGDGKPYREAVKAVETECQTAIREAIAQRKGQVAEAIEIAVDLKQPIRLENLVYFAPLSWPTL